MSEPYTEILADDDEDPGVHRAQFANAVSTWAWMQQRPITILEATIAFNTTPELIIQAVQDHHWMFLVGPDDDGNERKIEHDGE